MKERESKGGREGGREGEGEEEAKLLLLLLSFIIAHYYRVPLPLQYCAPGMAAATTRRRIPTMRQCSLARSFVTIVTHYSIFPGLESVDDGERMEIGI